MLEWKRKGNINIDIVKNNTIFVFEFLSSGSNETDKQLK